MVVEGDHGLRRRRRMQRRPALPDAAAADGERLERGLHLDLPVAQLEPAHAAGEADRERIHEAEVVEERPLPATFARMRHAADVEGAGLEVELAHGALRAPLHRLVAVQPKHPVRVPPLRLDSVPAAEGDFLVRPDHSGAAAEIVSEFNAPGRENRNDNAKTGETEIPTFAGFQPYPSTRTSAT